MIIFSMLKMGIYKEKCILIQITFFINYGFKAYREQEKNYVFLLLVMRNYLRNYFL